MKIIVTGGAGYIGSHFVKYALAHGIKKITVIDNLSRGHVESIPENVEFVNCDLRDNNLSDVIGQLKADAVVHFAAYAYVGESVKFPEKYYNNNVLGTINLLKAIRLNSIDKIVFSSTCSLYGNVKEFPLNEDVTPCPINPYAKTKYFIENILNDYAKAGNLKYVALRYFNAAGCDFDGEIGESHSPEPHLIPRVLLTAKGELDKIQIFGDDYNTEDGTCIRDYIHVNDLADAHLKALNYLSEGNESNIFNLGSQNGYSVKQIIDIAKLETGKDIKYEITQRRVGDPACLISDASKAKKILNWQTQFNLNDIIKSAWEWFNNPKY